MLVAEKLKEEINKAYQETENVRKELQEAKAPLEEEIKMLKKSLSLSIENHGQKDTKMQENEKKFNALEEQYGILEKLHNHLKTKKKSTGDYMKLVKGLKGHNKELKDFDIMNNDDFQMFD